MKADGVDVIKGLSESTHGLWSGDTDMNDGKLDQLHQEFTDRLKFVKGIGLDDRAGVPIIISDLQQALEETRSDKEFIINGKSKYIIITKNIRAIC